MKVKNISANKKKKKNETIPLEFDSYTQYIDLYF